MTKDEALKLALEFIERVNKDGWILADFEPQMYATITAIKEALAQPDQEPVAWRTFDGEGGYEYRTYDMNEQYAEDWAKRNPKHKGWVEPLYASPPKRQPLTDAEIWQMVNDCSFNRDLHADKFARAIEAAHGIGDKT